MLTPNKLEYNQILARVKKAEDMFDDDKYTQKEKDSWLPKYKELCDRLEELLGMIQFYEGEEMMDGFVEKKQESFDFRC